MCILFRYALWTPNAGADIAITRLVMYVKSRSNPCLLYRLLFCETIVRILEFTSNCLAFLKASKMRKTLRAVTSLDATRSAVMDVLAPSSPSDLISIDPAIARMMMKMTTELNITTRSNIFQMLDQNRLRFATYLKDNSSTNPKRIKP